MEEYVFTDIDTSQMTKKELMKKLSSDLKTKIEAEKELVSSDDIGQIFLSCVPLDERYFVPLDGRILIKIHYPDLYNVYKERFTTDHGEAYNQDVYFTVPDCYSRALIMQDPDGILDNRNRAIGSNLDWRFCLDKLLDFDLNKQETLIKNVTTNEESSKTNRDHFVLTDMGKSCYVVKSSSDYALEGTEYSDSPTVRLSNKLKFHTRKVYFYTKFGRYLGGETQ